MPRIGIIVLAAGRSTRFATGSTSKLLAAINGVPLVRLSVAAASDAGIGEVVVVTGDRPAEIAAALAGLPIRIAHEPAFADGMAASLGTGVRTLRGIDAVMVGLGDEPEVRPEAYRRVAARWQATGAPIVVPRYAGARVPSHPTLFASSLFDELLALRGDVGARAIIERHVSRVVEEPLEWPAPTDVDTVEDLDAYLDRAQSASADGGDRTATLTSSETDTHR